MTNNELSHRVIRLELSALLMLLAFALLVPFPHSRAQQKHRQLKREEAQQASAASERRVALVIGNSAYKVGPLKNPVNDARAMSKALGELGFDVTRKEDLSQSGMKAAIREFGAKIRRGGVGLFYYAGHGVEARGENYLIPVDATPESVEEIEYEAVDAGFVLAQMESAGNGMNIMILDACRDNPFARGFRSTSKGLARMNAPSGTIIAYATAPGSVAIDGGGTGNGVYTKELLTLMRTPGLAIEEVFKRVRIAVSRRTRGKQIPWESTSLMGDFYFRKRLSGSGVLTADTGDEETDHWEDIKESLKREDFEVYLVEHPSGRYSDMARERIQSLTLQEGSRPEALKAEPTPNTISPAYQIRFDGVYRSIKEDQISWVRFYKADWPIGRVTRGTTQVDAPEEVTRWLDRLTRTKAPPPPPPYFGGQSDLGTFNSYDNKVYLDYQNRGPRFDSDAVGTVVEERKLLLTQHRFGPSESKVYEFVKVELQTVGSELTSMATVGTSGATEALLKGFKIDITSAGPLQKVAPKVAERLRSLGAEVEVDFQTYLPMMPTKNLQKRLSYRRGQKDAAKRIASLIKDLVDVSLKESESDSMPANTFYVTLTK